MSTAAEGSRAGFTLIEVLVALVVAGLLLTVLGRAFAEGWSSAHAPMDIVSAVTVARTALQDGPIADRTSDARAKGFTVERRSGPVEVITQASTLAPAPAAAGSGTSAPGEAAIGSPAGGAAPTIGSPAGLGTPAAQPPKSLRRITVVVTTPLGRKVTFETVRLDSASD